MPRLNRNIFKKLIEKTNLTPQRIYQMVNDLRKKSPVPISKEDAFYLLAWNRGVDIYDFIYDDDVLNRLKDLQSKIVLAYRTEKIPKKSFRKERNTSKKISLEKIIIENFNIDPELIADCFSPLRTPYRSSVNEAFLTLETRIRRILDLPDNIIGQNLISKADQLGIFNRDDPGEKHALSLLFKGAIGWLGNPSHHKKIQYDKSEAIKMILFADYLIKLFEDLSIDYLSESNTYNEANLRIPMVCSFIDYMTNEHVNKIAEAVVSNKQIQGAYNFDMLKECVLKRKNNITKDILKKIEKMS